MCIIKRQTDKQTNECIDSYKNVPSMDVENHHHHQQQHRRRHCTRPHLLLNSSQTYLK